ncbi:hypothetical protein DSO57_1012806 [Entomophthora muscae]|uniref:Uncharacterized protein n=1 Tax=Entomophthora muscae TaxID=34485 RepID=A0ACC2URK6_9FUNG|nr:hypothetical protein DSO57_1012806 [Entomophthora muscae]
MDLWLNIFHGYHYSINDQPQCTRDTQLGEDDNGTKQDNSMAWETFGKPKHFEPVLTLFQVLKPRTQGTYLGKAKEEELLRQAYELMSMMVHVEADREIYEAAILLMAAVAIVKETPLLSGQFGDLDKVEVYGYTVKDLFIIIERVLLPSLVKRARILMKTCIFQKDRLKSPIPEEKVNMYLNMKTSYDKYLRFRNLDGFFEGSMLLSLAAAGHSGEGLSVGVAGNIVEICILTHDTYSVTRHYSSQDIINVHRYADGDVNGSIARAFSRTSLLNRRLRDSQIPRRLKQLLLNVASSYYLFTFSCERYGYSKDYSQTISFNLKEKRTLKSLETVHHMKNDKMISFAETVKLAFPEPLS